MDHNFERAYDFLMAHEGGFSDHKDDPGGTTRYGISLRYLQSQADVTLAGLGDGDLDGDGDVDGDDIALISKSQAYDHYFHDWWEKYPFAQMSGIIGAKLFDMTVNMGPRRACRLFQQAINLYRKSSAPIKEDGILGSKTIAAAEAIPTPRLMRVLNAVLCGFYIGLVQKNPSLQVFLHGWLARANAQP